MLEERTKHYIRDGIRNDINLVVKEKPIHTFLGSTDRKGYTLEFTAIYMDKKYQCSVVIEPYFSAEETKKIIERYKEEARHSLSESIYLDLFAVQPPVVG